MSGIFLILIFIILSILGYGLDTAWRSILRKRFIPAGYFNYPFCPLYGFGGVGIFLFYKLTENYSILFQILIGWLILVGSEFIGGLFLEHVLKVYLWSYSYSRFNIAGHIDLSHSLIWLTAAIIFRFVLYPITNNYVGMNLFRLSANDIFEMSTFMLMLVIITVIRYYTGPKNYCRLGGVFRIGKL